MSAQADATQKIAGDMENIAKWDVLLEGMFDESQVERIREQTAGMAPAPAPVAPEAPGF